MLASDDRHLLTASAAPHFTKLSVRGGAAEPPSAGTTNCSNMVEHITSHTIFCWSTGKNARESAMIGICIFNGVRNIDDTKETASDSATFLPVGVFLRYNPSTTRAAAAVMTEFLLRMPFCLIFSINFIAKNYVDYA